MQQQLHPGKEGVQQLAVGGPAAQHVPAGGMPVVPHAADQLLPGCHAGLQGLQARAPPQLEPPVQELGMLMSSKASRSAPSQGSMENVMTPYDMEADSN